MSINIRLEIDGADGTFKPGSTITGVVTLSSNVPIELEEVELLLTPPPGCGTAKELTGTLSRGMILEETTTLPLAANIDRNAGRDAEGTWTVQAIVRTEDGDRYTGSTSIHIAASAGQRTSAILTTLLFSIPFLAVGIAGMGFGIGGVPEKIIPEGVLWFAFGGGIAATLIARAILGAQDPTAATPFLSLPLAIALLAGAALGVYVTTVQPDLVPLRLNFTSEHLQSIFAVADHRFARAQIMGLFAAIILATAAGGLLSRRAVSPSLQVEIALVAATITCTLISLGIIADSYLETSHFAFPAMEFLWAGAVGAIALFYTFQRPTWTQAPAVTLLAGSIPLTVGLLGVAAESYGTIETATAGTVALWGATIIYLGGRNVLSAALAGGVEIQISPNPLSVGEALVLVVKGAPNSGVRMDGATGVLRCEQHTHRWVNGDQRTDIYEVYKERKHVQTPTTLPPGEAAEVEMRFVIPLGSLLSDTGLQAVIWTLDVTAHFGGRPDHAEAFEVVVTA